MKLGRLIVDNQSDGYYELTNFNTDDVIIGNNLTAYDVGLICSFKKRTKTKTNEV